MEYICESALSVSDCRPGRRLVTMLNCTDLECILHHHHYYAHLHHIHHLQNAQDTGEPLNSFKTFEIIASFYNMFENNEEISEVNVIVCFKLAGER